MNDKTLIVIVVVKYCGTVREYHILCLCMLWGRPQHLSLEPVAGTAIHFHLEKVGKERPKGISWRWVGKRWRCLCVFGLGCRCDELISQLNPIHTADAKVMRLSSWVASVFWLVALCELNSHLAHDECHRVHSHRRRHSTRIRCPQICSDSSTLSPTSCVASAVCIRLYTQHRPHCFVCC